MSTPSNDPRMRPPGADASTDAVPTDATVLVTPVAVIEATRPTLMDRIRAHPGAAFGVAVAVGWTAAKVLRGVMRARRRRRG